MARYVIFPGTAGSYADTPDVNVLDADTAHLYQSIGAWVTHRNRTAVGLVNDAGAVFGKALHWTVPSAGADSVDKTQNPRGLISATTSKDYSYGLLFKAPLGIELRLRVFFWDDPTGGNVFGSPLESPRVVGTGDWQWHVVTGSLDDLGAGGTYIYPSLGIYMYDVAGGEDAYTGGSYLKSDAVATFVPSLRIVGDIDLESKNAVFNPASGASQWLQTTRSGNDGYGLFINTTGGWGAYHGDGTAGRAGTADTTLVAGVAYTLRATMVAGTWTFLLDGLPDGTDVNVNAAAVPSGLALSFGQTPAATDPFQGDGYLGSTKDGEDGPIVAVFDAEDVGL